MNNKKGIIFTGALLGILAVLLVRFGNPPNMGICVACFIRDIAGAVGMHQAAVVQYLRPEIIGFILGAFIIAHGTKEFKVTGGSSPMIRFFLGIFMMIGALVFLGCPLRMVLRMAAGDLNALAGLAGFIAGVIIGTQFIKGGFTLGRSYQQNRLNGYILPTIAVILLVFRVVAPQFIIFSQKGPGSLYAPVILTLLAGLIIGIFAQRSRLCMAGGVRDLYLIKDPHLILGFLSIFVFALLFSLLFGGFQLGFADQPIAHSDGLWNFLGMLLAGYAAVLLGGCPLRQLILAGEGNTDSAITFLGMLVGAAISHNFALAATPAGVGINGKIAVIIGLLLVSAIGFINILFNQVKWQVEQGRVVNE